MNLPNNIAMTSNLLKSYRYFLKNVEFAPGKSFYWSPKDRVIHYDEAALDTEVGQWALLHEIAHAKLNHADYTSDFQLLTLEVAAWQKAEKLAKSHDIQINEDHIQDCLDTYREWLYARSTCPTCRLNSLQTDQKTYSCPNCRSQWSVSRSRFCRPYRMKSKHTKTPSGIQTVFE